MLQQKYRVARRNRDAAVVGMAFSGIMAVPTHGTSLFGLLFTIPRYVHYSHKLSKYRERMVLEGLEPLPRTKRDFALPLVMGAGSATLGTVLGDVGALQIMGGPMDGFFHHLMDTHAMTTAMTDGTKLMGEGPGEKISEIGLGFIFDRLIDPFNRKGRKRSETMDSNSSSSSDPVLYDGVRDMLLKWGIYGNEKDLYEGEEEFLAAVGRTEEEMLYAIENIDELIHVVMDSIFDEEELKTINKHLTDHAIFDIMRTVLSSAQYQNLVGDDEGEELKLYFKHLVLSATKDIRRKKQVVQSVGEVVTPLTPVTPTRRQTQMALHYGIPCNGCEDLEIEGVRYNCTGCDGEDVNYCYECFMNDEHEDHVLQHKWIAFHTSSYDLTPASERIPQTPLPDANCSVCEIQVQEDRFNCRDCDQFDVCRECFRAGGKTLHETHTFALISPFGYQVVDRDSYFSTGFAPTV